MYPEECKIKALGGLPRVLNWVVIADILTLKAPITNADGIH